MRPNKRDNVQTAGQNKPSEGDQDPDTEQRGLKCLSFILSITYVYAFRSRSLHATTPYPLTHMHTHAHTHVGFHGKQGLFIGVMVFILYKPCMYHSLQETVHFYFIKKTNSVWFISLLNYEYTENVLINPFFLVIPMSYPCNYTNLCPHKHAHTHTHTLAAPIQGLHFKCRVGGACCSGGQGEGEGDGRVGFPMWAGAMRWVSPPPTHSHNPCKSALRLTHLP